MLVLAMFGPDVPSFYELVQNRTGYSLAYCVHYGVVQLGFVW